MHLSSRLSTYERLVLLWDLVVKNIWNKFWKLRRSSHANFFVDRNPAAFRLGTSLSITLRSVSLSPSLIVRCPNNSVLFLSGQFVDSFPSDSPPSLEVSSKEPSDAEMATYSKFILDRLQISKPKCHYAPFLSLPDSTRGGPPRALADFRARTDGVQESQLHCKNISCL